MKLKIFTFQFSESVRGFDDEPMQTFIVDKEVIEYTEHFFVHEKTPYLTVLISYRDIAREASKKRSRGKDPRKELDDREKKVYDALKAWRTARSRQDGVPVYIIANNRQLAEMVKIKAGTKADLAGVKGIGDAKVAQYGADILKILSGRVDPDSENGLENKEGKET